MHQISYTSDGGTSEFFFNIKWFNPSDIQVAIDDVPTVPSAYSVRAPDAAGVAPFIGGRVIFENPPAAGRVIKISRRIALARPIDYQSTEKITPEQLNADFDYILEALRDMGAVNADDSRIAELVVQLAALGDISKIAYTSDIPDIGPIMETIATLRNTVAAIEIPEIPELSAVATSGSYNDLTDTPDLSDLGGGLPDGADYVIESSAPGVNPWYRKYKSGWVEQGGECANGYWSEPIVTMPIPMLDTSYHVAITDTYGAKIIGSTIMTGLKYGTKTQTGFQVTGHGSGNNPNGNNTIWEVKGYADK
ncbi:MAG: hypothetical protein LBR41_01370 [Rickettsiales bacterium]|jgi:hypothetical protein|nr:hypothetical protein [Rickettsiales bacterium]